MQNFLIQVTLGSNFTDLSVTARNEDQAVAKAKALVKKDASLALFRHSFANYIV